MDYTNYKSQLQQAEALLERVLEIIPTVENKTTLSSMFAGLYNGIFEPAREACEDEHCQIRYIESSQFDVFGAGATVLRALSVSRVVILSGGSNPEIVLEFNEPAQSQLVQPDIRLELGQKGEAKTFTLPNCLIEITGEQIYQGYERSPGVSLVLCINNLSPGYIEISFASQVRVKEPHADSNNFLDMVGLRFNLDVPVAAPGGKSSRDILPQKGVLTLQSRAYGFGQLNGHAAGTWCRLNEFGAASPMSKSELDNLSQIRILYFVKESLDRAKSKLSAQVNAVKQILEEEQPNRVAAFNKVQKSWETFAKAQAAFSVMEYMSDEDSAFSTFCTNKLIELMKERTKVLKEFTLFDEA
jgi:hypothetical protein